MDIVQNQPCDGCTVCCDILPVPVLNKAAYSKCVFCKNNGCQLHGRDEKPKYCLSYVCMYAQEKKVDIDLRPDKCGILFERVNSKVIFGIQVPDLEPTEKAERQIKDFIGQGFSVVIKQRNQRIHTYLNPNDSMKEVEKAIIQNIRNHGNIRN